MSFAVTACSRCGEPWAVDLRHASASCPKCAAKAELAGRPHLWQGDSAQHAQAAVATLRLPAEAAQAVQALRDRPAKTLPRHDSPIDAAAAQGVGIRNKSERAEAVALALTRLMGQASHDDLRAALERSGLDVARAENEIQRLLAMDLMMEPRAGYYECLA